VLVNFPKTPLQIFPMLAGKCFGQLNGFVYGPPLAGPLLCLRTKSSDKRYAQNIFLSIIAIWAIGHSEAAFSMTYPISTMCFCYRFYQLPDKIQLV